jgi:hypothetical protein
MAVTALALISVHTHPAAIRPGRNVFIPAVLLKLRIGKTKS